MLKILFLGLAAALQSDPSIFDVDSLAAPDASARIAAVKPIVAVRYDGRTAKVTVTDGRAPAADVARLALSAFVRCDGALKLFVTPELRQGIERGESFIRVDFAGAVTVKAGSGKAATTVRSMLVPLTGRWSQGGQTFFYAGAEGRWVAWRWSKPDSATWLLLLGAVAKMAR